MMALYSAALSLLLVLGLPYWLVRMATTRKYRAGLGERLGRVPQRLTNTVAGKQVVWLHAVSVGEVLAASRLVSELDAALPGCVVVVSTTTLTGQRLARERFGAERVFYFPLDLRFIVRKYLSALKPQMLVLAETEFWPNMLVACRERGVPVAVVNARISDRSLPRYRRLRSLWRRLLEDVEIFLAQTDEDARRLVEIGVAPERVAVAGNLKFDVRSAQNTPLTAALRQQLPAGAKVLVCGSTLEGEENAILDCWPKLQAACPQVVLVLAPRHPERFEAVARLLDASGAHWIRRSDWLPPAGAGPASAGPASLSSGGEASGASPQPLAAGTVLLLDSIGELSSVYALASVAFVGGSLFGAGGHNPLEPAQFGVPVVMGESHENFRGIVVPMLEAKAICIVLPSQLCLVLEGMLLSDAEARAMGERGRVVFASQAGATARTVEALLGILDRGQSGNGQSDGGQADSGQGGRGQRDREQNNSGRSDRRQNL
ncbi:MAG: 3-deoxy-D-manno-octulosonic acid transferase [Acidobacteriaceae bacterium]